MSTPNERPLGALEKPRIAGLFAFAGIGVAWANVSPTRPGIGVRAGF